jgi:hypothetical protein
MLGDRNRGSLEAELRVALDVVYNNVSDVTHYIRGDCGSMRGGAPNC